MFDARSFLIVSLVATAVVVACAARFRSRAYAIFRGVSLTLHSLLAAGMWGVFGESAIGVSLYVYLHAAVFVHSLVLVRPAMRPLWYRAVISVPGAFFAAATFLALPWAVLRGLGFDPWAAWLAYALALVGVFQSLTAREEEVHVSTKRAPADGLRRVREPKPVVPSPRPLRIVQITDPHLGPFMSVERLRRICRRAVAKNPDLVVLTGDFLTMESQRDPSVLAAALEPLGALRGKVFSCLGNHDYEALDTVRAALASNGVTLLSDDCVVVQTEAGAVQLLGFHYRFKDRARHLAGVCTAHPRQSGAFRLLLLHDPGAFRHLPEGEGDLVLSGHTHGGQVGLVSVGLPWTLLRVVMNAPDHGLWARGRNLLYVHRGTGHYGFPLRLGVPAEESVLVVHSG